MTETFRGSATSSRFPGRYFRSATPLLRLCCCFLTRRRGWLCVRRGFDDRPDGQLCARTGPTMEVRPWNRAGSPRHPKTPPKLLPSSRNCRRSSSIPTTIPMRRRAVRHATRSPTRTDRPAPENSAAPTWRPARPRIRWRSRSSGPPAGQPSRADSSSRRRRGRTARPSEADRAAHGVRPVPLAGTRSSIVSGSRKDV